MCIPCVESKLRPGPTPSRVREELALPPKSALPSANTDANAKARLAVSQKENADAKAVRAALEKEKAALQQALEGSARKHEADARKQTIQEKQLTANYKKVATELEREKKNTSDAAKEAAENLTKAVAARREATKEKKKASAAEAETARKTAEAAAATAETAAIRKQLTKEIETIRGRFHKFKEACGIGSVRGVPPIDDGTIERTLNGWNSSRTRVINYLKTPLKGRHVADVALAIKRSGIDIRALVGTPEFDEAIYEIIQLAADSIQDVWGPRHSVHVMSDLSLSRDLFELLRHLLSFLYHPPNLDAPEDAPRAVRGNWYERRTMWESEHDPKRKVYFPELQPRQPREAEREKVLKGCKLVQSADGLSATREDLVESVGGMVAFYWGSGSLLPQVESGEVPLDLMGYGDATGGWRAASVSHFETGICSWDQGVASSKLTLLPCHMMEKDDHASNLRANAKPVFEGWQQIIKTKTLRFFPRTNADVQLAKVCRTDFRMAGDFQILKSINNMSLYTSPIWCECDKAAINYWPEKDLPNWEAILKYFNMPGKGITACVVKSLARICQLNGWSLEVLLGKAFVEFNCGQPCKAKHTWKTLAAWQAWKNNIQAMEHEEYAAYARGWGRDHSRHYPGYAPMLWDEQLGMMLFSCDILHLIYINYFKQHLELLVWIFLLELSEAAREPIEVFIHSKGIPIKLAKAQNLTEVSKSLTGRDSKVLCEKAAEILPELLDWAHAPQEAVEAAAKEIADEIRAEGSGQAMGSSSQAAGSSGATSDAHANVFTMRRPRRGAERDIDDDDDPSDEDTAAGVDKVPDVDEKAAAADADAREAKKLRYAGYLDDFSLVRPPSFPCCCCCCKRCKHCNHML